MSVSCILQGQNIGVDVLEEVIDEVYRASTELTRVHIDDKNNPHEVTIEQIGAAKQNEVMTYVLASLPKVPATPIAADEEIPWSWNEINLIALSGHAEDWISVGAIKSVTLSEAVLGTTTHDVRVIGINQDNDQSITFQTKNALVSTTLFGSSALWISSIARELCALYYDVFPGRTSIKTVSKGTCPNIDSSRAGTVTYNDETVWLPSEREMGLDSYSPLSVANSTISNAECTKGKNFSYAYYTSNTNRVKNQGDSGSAVYYWGRSRLYTYSIGVCIINNDGSANRYNYNSTTGRLAPAFVIGNETISNDYIEQNGADITWKIKNLLAKKASGDAVEDYQVGDILTTARTNLEDNWALCNGDAIWGIDEEEKQIYEILHTFEWPIHVPNGYNKMGRPRKTNKENIVFTYDYSGTIDQMDISCCGIYNYRTNEYKSIFEVNNVPDGVSDLDKLFGVDWNGTEWVACFVNDTIIKFFTSSDLDEWTIAYTFQTSEFDKPISHSLSYAESNYMFDGSFHRVLGWAKGYSTAVMYSFTSDFSKFAYKTDAWHYMDIGDEFIVCTYNTDTAPVIYSAKTIDAPYITQGGAISAGKGQVLKVSESKSIIIQDAFTITTFFPAEKKIKINQTGIPDLNGNELNAVWMDTENVYFCFTNSSTSTKNAITKCSIAGVSEGETHQIVLTGVDVPTYSGYAICGNDFVTTSDSWVAVYPDGPKRLPEISQDGLYSYIKVQE